MEYSVKQLSPTKAEIIFRVPPNAAAIHIKRKILYYRVRGFYLDGQGEIRGRAKMLSRMFSIRIPDEYFLMKEDVLIRKEEVFQHEFPTGLFSAVKVPVHIKTSS